MEHQPRTSFVNVNLAIYSALHNKVALKVIKSYLKDQAVVRIYIYPLSIFL